MKRLPQFEQFPVIPQLRKWFIISCIVGMLSGLGSAPLLASLEWQLIGENLMYGRSPWQHLIFVKTLLVAPSF
ncbi:MULTISPECIES: hypothetical protein [unclassified Microcoleus]|uniref:hypothetical protein n=1 Tax=unclassified Microcoleus TaxID=2642155 RepID=UPI002FCFAB73